MVLLRDGEWSVWCHRCQWRSPAPSSLALAMTSGHRCGSSGSPATSGGVGPLLPAEGVRPGGYLRGNP